MRGEAKDACMGMGWEEGPGRVVSTVSIRGQATPPAERKAQVHTGKHSAEGGISFGGRQVSFPTVKAYYAYPQKLRAFSNPISTLSACLLLLLLASVICVKKRS